MPAVLISSARLIPVATRQAAAILRSDLCLRRRRSTTKPRFAADAAHPGFATNAMPVWCKKSGIGMFARSWGAFRDAGLCCFTKSWSSVSTVRTEGVHYFTDRNLDRFILCWSASIVTLGYDFLIVAFRSAKACPINALLRSKRRQSFTRLESRSVAATILL